MSELIVEAPGFLTTVQDLGRPGHAASGVSASGAADPIALTVGNRLVGNDPGAAALEMTMIGGAFRPTADAVVALTGAETGARADRGPVLPWCAISVRAGETITCSALRAGARSYLCIRGGIQVPLLLGSASTHLLTGLGGLSGRALREGDRLPIGAIAPRSPLEYPVDPSAIPSYGLSGPFRLTPGPQGSWFDERARRTLYESDWRVTESCDRMGIRLAGEPVRAMASRELTTEGVPLGAIQVPPAGSPIVLFVEHQTTGGYPKIANVISADLPRLGGLRPRDTIAFQAVSRSQAHALLRAQKEALDAILA